MKTMLRPDSAQGVVEEDQDVHGSFLFLGFKHKSHASMEATKNDEYLTGITYDCQGLNEIPHPNPNFSPEETECKSQD
jgi:hypothetical protein